MNDGVIQPLVGWQYGQLWELTGKLLIHPEATAGGELIYRLRRRQTLVRPPPADPGTVPVFLEKTQSWIVVADHRGEVWFDWRNDPVVIERLGSPDLWDLSPEPLGGKVLASGT